MKRLCSSCGKDVKGDFSICRSCKLYLCYDCVRRIGDNYDLCKRCFERFMDNPQKDRIIQEVRPHPTNSKNEERIIKAHAGLRQCFEELRSRILELPNAIEKKRQEWRNYYIEGNRKYFVCTKVLREFILIGIKIDASFKDRQSVCPKKKSTYYGSDKHFKLYPKDGIPKYIEKEGVTDNIDYTMKLIKQSYYVTAR